VFEPFFTTKPEGEGTGLGLSMAYGFIKQSGGHIRVYSEVGLGTTVKIYLPRAFAVATDVAVVRNPAVLGGSETVLVVEDDHTVQSTVVETLSQLGYTVLKADDAQSALSIVRSGVAIDLLFTDVVMPGPLRSPEMARQALLILPRLKVLFTSGYTQNAIVHGGRLDPGVELLSKPYSREQLAYKIRHVLGGAAAASTAVVLESRVPAHPAPQDAAAAAAPSLHILVVEDHEDLRESVCQLLGVLGHHAWGVASGEQALSALDQQHYQVLLTDITLPGMSGVALAHAATRAHPALAVVFASGRPVPAEQAFAFPWLALRKPYSIENLEEVLAQLGRAPAHPPR
jgi:CheY-like chemotaxis protein